MARSNPALHCWQDPRRVGWAALAALLLLVASPGRAADAGAPPAQERPIAAEPDRIAQGWHAAEPDRIAQGWHAAEPDRIAQAWHAPAASLAQRAQRTRRAALESGVWSLDPAARALLRAPGSPLERAEAAVALAPDLPAARMALAHALWRRGDSPLAALRALVSALTALARHLEATLWLAGSALAVLAVGLVVGGMICAFSAGVLAAPHAAHDLGDALGGGAPAFARMALLAALVCAPAWLGEGLLGLAVAVVALAALYGDGRERIAVAGAAAAVWVGLFPLATLAGRSLEAFGRDPVVRAALAVDHGRPSPVDLAALRSAASAADEVAPDAAALRRGPDPLAERALARLARREGRLGEADARYQALLATASVDAALANDAANVRLRLAHLDSALELYDRSLAIEPSPLVLFNLSQAHGRAFEVEGLTRALERAQALDGELVAELAELQGAAETREFVVDLPLPRSLLWSRLVRAGDGLAFAAEARAPLAPGRLGRDPALALGVLAAALALGSLAGSRIARSRWCARCGRRTCPSCHGARTDSEVCSACHRLFFQPEQTQRDLRLSRVARLEERRRRLDRVAVLTALLVPGAAGLLASRPFRGLVACILFAVAAAAVAWRDGVVPDPDVAGAAGPVALLALGGLAALGYAALVTTSLATRRSAR